MKLSCLPLNSIQTTAAAAKRVARFQQRGAVLARSAILSRAAATTAASRTSSTSRGATANATRRARAIHTRAMAASMEEKPLLSSADGGFPLYDKVKADQVVPSMKELLADLGGKLDELEGNLVAMPEGAVSWDKLVVPLEEIVDRLGRTWSVVTHLKAVCDTEELRNAVEEVQPDQVAFSLRLSQSETVYRGFRAIRDGPEWDTLSEPRKRIVLENIRDAELAGVALEGEQKERFNAIQQELSKLSTKFSNNVLDGTKAFSKTITDKEDVAGLPKSALALASQTAKDKGHPDATAEDGPWVFTLDIPSYLPVMLHAKNRSLREELYKTYLTRASSGDIDNTPVIERILVLRKEMANLLGYACYADVSLASKMAKLDQARNLLEELRLASYDAAVEDLKEVTAFGKETAARFLRSPYTINERLS